MPNVKSDENRVRGLLAETNDSNRTPTPLVVDPTTGRLLVSSTISNLGGFIGGITFDSITLVQATLTDTWTYTLSGNTVAVIVVTFTAAGKTVISTVARTV